MNKRNSTLMKQRMEGRWLQAFKVLAPALDRAIENLGKNVPCPIEGGKDGFRLFKNAPLTGGGVKQSSGVIPEGIAMLMWVNDWGFIKAFDELEAWLGDKPRQIIPVSRIVPKTSEQDKLAGWLNTIWMESVPLTDVSAHTARAYFSRRWIKPAALAAEDIRFHPKLNYRDQDGVLKGRFAAIVCRVRNNLGEPVALHRTYLTPNGMKINMDTGSSAKKLTPVLNKGAAGMQIRLFPASNGCLGICEGLETALAVYQAKRFPVWCGISAAMLPAFVPPSGVHTVINFVDKDRSQAGETAATILKTRLANRGVRVINLLPPTPILSSDKKGVDWADQLKRDVSGFHLVDQFFSGKKLA